MEAQNPNNMRETRPPVVIDTNILFSALLREPSRFVSLIFQIEYLPRTVDQAEFSIGSTELMRTD